MARVNPGKRFERAFKASMDAIGYALRIPDRCFLSPSGRLLSEPSEGDFLFFAKDGGAYLVECKATKLARFPFENLRPEQEASLLRFDGVSDLCHGIVALNFYGESLRSRNALYLVGITDYMRHKAASKRKSLSEKEAEAIGHRCERQKGGTWGLPLQEQSWLTGKITVATDSPRSIRER